MKLKILHYIGKLLGIHFKVDGLPYGVPGKKGSGGLASSDDSKNDTNQKNLASSTNLSNDSDTIPILYKGEQQKLYH